MGVLPLFVRELAEGTRDALVKIVAGSLHPVAGATRIGAAEAFGGWHVEEKGQIRNEAGRRQTVGGAYLGLGQSATKDLVRISGQKKSIEQNHLARGERRQDLARDQLRARRHEQKRLGGVSDLVLAMQEDVPDGVAGWSTARLAQRDAGDARGRQTLRQQADLRALASALGPFEDDELSARAILSRA